MRAAAWALFVLGVLTLLAAIVLAAFAIWVDGQTSIRLGYSAGLAFMVGLFATGAGAVAVDGTGGFR